MVTKDAPPPSPSPDTLTIVIEQTPSSTFGAYIPELAGVCAACADSRDECLRLILDSLQFHLDAARDMGLAP